MPATMTFLLLSRSLPVLPARWRRWLYGQVVFLAILLTLLTPATADDFKVQREQMVAVIEQDVRDTRSYLGKDALDARVKQALLTVPRHEFVPPVERPSAYENRPLPIGYGQTISQPYIVAIMTDLLQIKPGDAVFELGSGSGYQAAVAAQLAGRVYTMEIIAALGDKAKETLARLNYSNVTVRVGDGYYGWEEHAPFDAIIVTAAGDHIPPALLRQLKPGGRMIIPVGGFFLTQQLMLVEKQQNGSIRSREILPVAFVPITGSH